MFLRCLGKFYFLFNPLKISLHKRSSKIIREGHSEKGHFDMLVGMFGVEVKAVERFLVIEVTVGRCTIKL